MLEGSEQRSGTRWGRGALVLVPSLVVTGGLGVLIAQGALAANFAVGNQQLQITADSLDAQGLGLVLSSANVREADGSTTPTPIMHALLKQGTLNNLCLIAHQTLLGQTYSVVLAGPPGQEPIKGANITFDVTGLKSSPAMLTNAVLGKSADEINVGGSSLQGQPGGFGLDLADGTASLQKLQAPAYSAEVLGSLAVPNLNISLKPGEVPGC